MDPSSVQQLVAETAMQLRERLYGKYRGTVVDTQDPQGLGRIKAAVPEVFQGETTPWALPCVPFAGDDEGQFMVPPVGAGVWIEFEAGDPSRPVWTGCYWGADQPPKNNAGDDPTPAVKVLKSETGLMVTMDDDARTLDVSDADGRNVLKLEVQSGQVTLKAASKVVVEAPQIQLVDQSTHPVVFGDDLLNYLSSLVNALQTHVHAGEVAAGIFPVTPAPPANPFPIPQPTLLSTKVTSG